MPFIVFPIPIHAFFQNFQRLFILLRIIISHGQLTHQEIRLFFFGKRGNGLYDFLRFVIYIPFCNLFQKRPILIKISLLFRCILLLRFTADILHDHPAEISRPVVTEVHGIAAISESALYHGKPV